MPRLTDNSVRALTPPEQGAKIHHCDTLTGFGVRVTSTGIKSFVLTYGTNRERRTIGRYPLISLQEARSEARRFLAERTLGKHQSPRQSFLEAMDSFLAYHAANNRPGTHGEVRRILTKQFASLHRHRLSEVTTHDITRITDRMIEQGYPSAANHAYMAARNFLHWCVRRRLIPHSPLEGLEKPAPTPSRERILSDDELRAVWHATDAIPGSFGIIIRLLILTGQRRGEIASLKAEWCSLPSSKDGTLPGFPAPLAVGGENTDCEVRQALDDAGQNGKPFNLSAASECRSQCTITIPSTHTKNGRAHRLPIGAFCAELLTKAMSTPPPASGYIFSGRTNGSFNSWSKAKAQFDKKVAVLLKGSGVEVSPWTLHDLRRTYATNLQRLGVKLEVIEALLNHVSGTRAGIVGVYNRHRYEAEMREAVNTYENWFSEHIAVGTTPSCTTPGCTSTRQDA